MSDNKTPDTQSFVVVNNIYICLIPLVLASIAIKCQGSVTNPFQDQGPSMLIFLVALFCHAIALKAKISLPTTAIIHVSGVTACETLLWILVAKFWWCIIINIVLLLLFVALFFYKDTYQILTNVITPCSSWIKETYGKVRRKGLNADKPADLETQQGIEAPVSSL